MYNRQSTDLIAIGTGSKTLSKIRDGNSAISINLSNDSHVVPCDEYGLNGNYKGCETVVKLYMGNHAIAHNNFTITKSEGLTGKWEADHNKYTVSSIRDGLDSGWVEFTAVFDNVEELTARFTISKVYNGKDAYTVNISNDSHTFTADSSGLIDRDITTYTDIQVFKGNEELGDGEYSISIPGENSIPGLRVSNSGTRVTITAKSGRDLSLSGSFRIGIRLKNGKTIFKEFSWSKVKDGTNGYTIVALPANFQISTTEHGVVVGAKEYPINFDIIDNIDGQSVKFTIESFKTPKGLAIERNRENNGIIVKINDESALEEKGIIEVVLLCKGVSFYQSVTYNTVKNGESPYTVMLYSTNGILFKDGITNTVIEAVVRKGIKRINDELPEEAFKWAKKDKEGHIVEGWTPKYYGRGHDMIVVTSDDVFERTTFECSIEMK